jgi:hypothetical protein
MFSVLVVPCSDANKACFAVQQLRGTARVWWDNYFTMLPINRVVSWEEFKNAFLALTQGTRTTLQYAQAFNNLYQYAGYHADSDAKKHDRFRRGLSTKLKDRLNSIKVDTCNELVNLAITQEDCILAHHADKKRKAPAGPSSALAQRYRSVQNDTSKAPQKAPQQGRWVFRPPQQQSVARPPMPQQTGPRPIACSQLVRATQIIALIVGVLATLHENAPSLGSQMKGKFLIRTIRTRAKDRLFMFSREGSISLHLLIFQKVRQ